MTTNKPSQSRIGAKTKWSVHDSKVNLAALLNDPRKVRRDYDLFTKTWGESFRDLPQGSTLRRSKWIPNVQRGHFADYLSNTGDQLMRHESQSLKNFQKVESEENDFAEGSTFANNDAFAIKSAVTAQRERDAIIKTRKALDALPKLFLKTDFNMGNPQVFASVLDVNSGNEESRHDEGGRRRHESCSSRMLQDKLSHYLDRVEMAIVRQISLQSDSFFKAMESHEELHEYLNNTMKSVQNLIAKVKVVKKNIVENSLQVVHLRRSQINSKNLLAKLQMMITVHQTQPTIQLLLSTSEYAGSLDLIRTTQEVLHQELAGLHSFRHLSSQLTEMERVIGQMMRQDMDECLRDEIHRSVTEGHSCRDPHRLTAVTLGLIRQGQYAFLQEFREEIEVAVKTIIKDTVADAVVEPDREKKETLASKMRMLAFSEWIQLLNNLFDNLLVLLRRTKAILDVLSGVARDSAARGDMCRAPRFRKFSHGPSHRKTRLKSSHKILSKLEVAKETSANDNSNPFLDSASNSDSAGENLNPFEEESPQRRKNSNPFESATSSPQKSVATNGEVDASNPFLDDLSDQNDFGEALMDGLASYEDELINSAADSFVNPVDTPRTPTLRHNSHPPFESQISTDITPTDQGEEIIAEEVLTTDECNNFLSSLSDLLVWVLDFEQDRCVKVLIAKGKDNSLDKLSSSDFLKLAKSIERFTSEAEEVVTLQSGTDRCENIEDKQSRSINSSLRGALQTQAGRFVTRFHDERRNKLSLILDNEVWKQAEVPTELANLLQNMVKGKMSTEYSIEDDNSQTKVTINGHSQQQQKVLDYLELDGEQYVVVGTVLILLKMVSEYCKCSDDLPASTPDLIHRLRDLLTLFNSRTCQLILGAGALQLVGLKTITTKNLALASRCLQLVLHCIPSIKRHFEMKLMQFNQSTDDKSQKHRGVLRHFDHVTKDYQDHVNEVENKLTVIVLGVVERHLSKWEVKAPVPSPSFRNICKQITKFYDTVSSLLPQSQICRILLTLNGELKSRVRSYLHKTGVRNDGGPQHGLVTSDLTYYETNIKNLKGMEVSDLKMSTVWS